MPWRDIKTISDGQWLVIIENVKTEQLHYKIDKMNSILERWSAQKDLCELINTQFEIQRYGVTAA